MGSYLNCFICCLLAWTVSATFAAEKLSAEKKATAREKELMALFEKSLTWDKGRDEALKALRETITPDDIGILAKAVRDKRIGVRCHALLMMHHCRGERLSATPDLTALCLEGLKDREPAVRSMAAQCACSFAADSPKILKALIAALEDPDAGNIYSTVSASAAITLGGLGKVAKSAIPALIKATQDTKEELRTSALSALGLIARADVASRATIFRHLLAVLKEGKRAGDRCAATRAIAGSGREAAPLVPELRKIVKVIQGGKQKGADDIFAEIVHAYIRIGKDARPAIPDILPTLRSKTANGKVCSMIVWFIGSLGEDGKEFHPVLQQIADDETMPKGRRNQARSTLYTIRRLKIR